MRQINRDGVVGSTTPSAFRQTMNPVCAFLPTLILMIVAGLFITTAAAADLPACPEPGLSLIRNGHLRVRYEGEPEPGVCSEIVGGRPETMVFGIWPEIWPESRKAADVAREVLSQPTGSSDSFIVSSTVVGNGWNSSVTWRFTVTNLGDVDVPFAGGTRRGAKIGWDELILGHPYKAHGDIIKDVATGAILKQNFSTLYGSTAAAEEFWGKYGGGLSVHPQTS